MNFGWSFFLFGSELIEKIDIDLNELGLDQSSIDTISPFSVGFFFIALEGILTGDEQAYKEDIVATTTVDGLLYSVSLQQFWS